MHVVIRMLDHHLRLLGDIVDRVKQVDADVADRPIELSVEGIDADPTLRGLADKMVGQLEMCTAAVQGSERVPRNPDATPVGLDRRLRIAGRRFRELAIGALKTAGIDDLGAGDPMRFVGGTGEDAATISRRYAPTKTA